MFLNRKNALNTACIKHHLCLSIALRQCMVYPASYQLHVTNKDKLQQGGSVSLGAVTANLHFLL